MNFLIHLLQSNSGLPLGILLILFAGCSSERPNLPPPPPDIRVTEKGLTTGYSFHEINGKATERTDFTTGENLRVYFADLEGFNTEGGKVFPGLSMSLLSKTGDTLFYDQGLYEEGFTIDTATAVFGDLVIGYPLHPNAEYRVVFDLWDKRGEGTMQAKLNFSVRHNKCLDIQRHKVGYRDVYLVDRNNAPITDNRVSVIEGFVLIVEGLAGFTEEDGKIFPEGQFLVLDSKGQALIDEPKIYGPEGLDATTAREQLYYIGSFIPGQINNPIHFSLILSDSKSDAALQVTGEVLIENP